MVLTATRSARITGEALQRQEAGDAPTLDAALASIDGYSGVTGTISFAGGSRVPRKSVAILGVTSGKQCFVVEILPQSILKP